MSKLTTQKQKKKNERAERNRLNKAKFQNSKVNRIKELQLLQKMLEEAKAKRVEREANGEVFENDLMTDLVQQAFKKDK